jgi:hypothetical protein
LGIPSSVARWSALLLVVLFGLFTLQQSLVGVFRTKNPELALRLDGDDARALSSRASALLERGRLTARSPELVRADRMARRALERDLTIAGAARTLAIAAAAGGDQKLADRAISAAFRLSRRDLATQMWCIEDRVARNDVPAALHCYDVALRTHRSAQELLFPILVAATEDDALVPPLIDLLARRPPWLEQFLPRLVQGGRSIPNIVRIFAGLRRTGYQTGGLSTGDLVARLTLAGAFSEAWRAHLWLNPGDRNSLLRNGSFETGLPSVATPFQWSLVDNLDRRAEMLSPGARSSATALYLNQDNGGSGPLADQLLLLRPGTYELTGSLLPGTQAQGGAAQILVRCRPGDKELAKRSFATSSDQVQSFRMTFVVQPACRAQSLQIGLESVTDGPANFGIDELGLRPIGS